MNNVENGAPGNRLATTYEKTPSGLLLSLTERLIYE